MNWQRFGDSVLGPDTKGVATCTDKVFRVFLSVSALVHFYLGEHGARAVTGTSAYSAHVV